MGLLSFRSIFVFVAFILNSYAHSLEIDFNCNEGVFKLLYEQTNQDIKLSFYAYDLSNSKTEFNKFNFRYDSSKQKLIYDRGDGNKITERQETLANGEVKIGNLSIKDAFDSGGIDYSLLERASLTFNLNDFKKGFVSEDLKIFVMIPKVVMGTIQNDFRQLSCRPRFDNRMKNFLLKNIKQLENQKMSPIVIAMNQFERNQEFPDFSWQIIYPEIVEFVRLLIQNGASPNATYRDHWSAWARLLEPIYFDFNKKFSENYQKARFFENHKELLELFLYDKSVIPALAGKSFALLPFEEQCRSFTSGSKLYNCRYILNEKVPSRKLSQNPYFIEILSRLKLQIVEAFAKSNVETMKLKYDPIYRAEEMRIEVLLQLQEATQLDFTQTLQQKVDFYSEAKKELASNARNFCRQANMYYKMNHIGMITVVSGSSLLFIEGKPEPPLRFINLKSDWSAYDIEIRSRDIDDLIAEIPLSIDRLKQGEDEFIDNARPLSHDTRLLNRELVKKNSRGDNFESGMGELARRYGKCVENIYTMFK